MRLGKFGRSEWATSPHKSCLKTETAEDASDAGEAFFRPKRRCFESKFLNQKSVQKFALQMNAAVRR